MPKTNVTELLEDHQYLYNLNSNYRAYCQELADFFLPRRAWINSIRIQGERVRFKFLYDSTAILAAREAAHGIHSHLTNESTRWFGLQSTDMKDMKRQDVRLWFRELEDKFLDVLRNTNYYNVQLEDYHGKLVFGSGTYSMLDDAKDVVTYKNMSVENVCRVVDESGRLTEIYVTYRLPARKAFKIFGNNVGKSVMESLAKQPYKEFEFLHYVAERHDRDPRYEDSANMPYKSCWVNKVDKHLIAESGFMEMPYISDVFYSDSNDPNGFSPAMDVFPWVKLVNAMSRTVIRAAMKQTDPPLVSPSRGFVLPLNFNPAGMNYRDPKTPKDALQFLMPTGGGRIDIGFDLIKFVTDNIKQGMFLPLFQSLNNITKQLSVIEAQHIINQNMAILGPVVGRFDYGTLSPMIFRLYGIMSRNMEIPPPPEVLHGKSFRVMYLGQLAKAQRQAEVGEIQSWLQEVQSVATVLPNAVHNVNEDSLIKHLHKIRHLSPEFLRDEKDIERIRQHEAEQRELMQSMSAGQGAANIAKDTAKAQKEMAEAER